MDNSSETSERTTFSFRNFLSVPVFLTFLAFLFFLIVLIGFNHLDAILADPLLTPADYLTSHPWIAVEWGTLTFIWSEPSSTLFVYGLGILTILIGILLTKKGSSAMKSSQNTSSPNHNMNNFVKIWGIALIIWGIGTMLAGTSYQAFFYELKCRNHAYCLWTTWWEIGYLALTVISVNTMVIAQSSLRSNSKTRRALQLYAFVNLMIYLLILTVGMLMVNEFMLSFEMMVIFQLLSFILMMVQNIYEYRKTHAPVELSLIKIWLLLALVMAVYFGYFYIGVAELLWVNGIWFNANDILHVGLIGWMLFIHTTLKKYLAGSSSA